MGKSKYRRFLKDFIESDRFREIVREIMREDTLPIAVQEGEEVIHRSRKVIVDTVAPPKKIKKEIKKEKATPSVDMNVLRGKEEIHSTYISPRLATEIAEIGDVLLYSSHPRIEYAEDDSLLISSNENSSFSITLYTRSSRGTQKVKCPSRPLAVMKIENGFFIAFTREGSISVVKYNDSMEEVSNDTYEHIRTIAHSARICSYRGSMYRSDSRDGKLFLLEMKKNWIPGDIMCDCGDSVYIASHTRLRRYYMNKNSNIPVWEHVPVSSRRITSLQANESFVVYTSGRSLCFVDVHGEAHHHSFQRNIVSYCLRTKCYVLTNDSYLHTYDPERKKVIDSFLLDAHDLSSSLYATDDSLYYTTGSSVHRLSLS